MAKALRTRNGFAMLISIALTRDSRRVFIEGLSPGEISGRDFYPWLLPFSTTGKATDLITNGKESDPLLGCHTARTYTPMHVMRTCIGQQAGYRSEARTKSLAS